MIHSTTHQSPLTPWRCVAFDLDGTLVDSFPALRRAYASFLDSFGLKGSDDEFAKLNGPSMTVVVARLKDWRGLAGSVGELLGEYHRHVRHAYRTGIPAMPGAEALLALAKAQGWKRALVTSSPRNVVDHVLAGLRWDGVFDALACGDEVAESKPDPAVYRLACQRLACDAAQCIAIEDAEAGVMAAKACGIRVIGVGTTMPVDRLARAGADWTCTTLAEAADLFRQLKDGNVVGARC